MGNDACVITASGGDSRRRLESYCSTLSGWVSGRPVIERHDGGPRLRLSTYSTDSPLTYETIRMKPARRRGGSNCPQKHAEHTNIVLGSTAADPLQRVRSLASAVR